MIYFSESPTRKNHMAAVLALLCGLAGIATFACANFIDYGAILQTIGIVLLMIAVILLSRALVKYTYCLQKADADGLDELAVIEQRGQKRTTVCRLLLSDLKQTDVCTAKTEKMLQAQLAVSSAVEILMAEGIPGDTGPTEDYGIVKSTVQEPKADGNGITDVTVETDRFPNVKIKVEPVSEKPWFSVTVTSNDGLVEVETSIRKVS